MRLSLTASARPGRGAQHDSAPAGPRRPDKRYSWPSWPQPAASQRRPGQQLQQPAGLCWPCKGQLVPLAGRWITVPAWHDPCAFLLVDGMEGGAAPAGGGLALPLGGRVRIAGEAGDGQGGGSPRELIFARLRGHLNFLGFCSPPLGANIGRRPWGEAPGDAGRDGADFGLGPLGPRPKQAGFEPAGA